MSRVVDSIDHSPIPDTISKQSSKFPRKAFHIVMSARFVFKLGETSRQFPRERRVGRRVKRLDLRRKNDLKHPTEPCASSHPYPTQLPSAPLPIAGPGRADSERGRNPLKT